MELESSKVIVERTRLKYVHINSNHRLFSEDKSKFTVHMGGHPVKNVKRVAVKAFSLDNTIHNVRSDNNTLEWFEARYELMTNDNFEIVKRSISIPVGTYTTPTLVAEINAQIAANSALNTFDANDNPLIIALTSNPIGLNYTVSIGSVWVKPEGSSLAKAFLIGSGDFGLDTNLWDELGFTRQQQLDIHDYNLLVQSNAESVEDFIAIGEMPFNMTSLHPSTFEGEVGVYLTSDALTNGNSYESKIDVTTRACTAVPCNVLEWLQLDQPRYAVVNYQASILHWHYLNKTSIHEFDIQLRNQSGKLFDFDEINKFNLVLVFETVEVDEISADFIKQYNDEGYRIAHTRDRIQYKM